jgi:hypothetical protein
MEKRSRWTALLALALGCAHGAGGGGAAARRDEAPQAQAVRGIADFYGVGQQRELLWCVSLCEGARCEAPSAQFLARFAQAQYRVNEPGHCTWKDGRVTYSGRAAAQLGPQQVSLRTPPRGALYLDVGPLSACSAGQCTVEAKLTVGQAETRMLQVTLLERGGGAWQVQGIQESARVRAR